MNIVEARNRINELTEKLKEQKAYIGSICVSKGKVNGVVDKFKFIGEIRDNFSNDIKALEEIKYLTLEINKSNYNTYLEVPNIGKYNIQELILLKAGLKNELKFYLELLNQCNTHIKKVNNENDKMELRLNNIIDKIISDNPEFNISTVKDSFTEQNEWDLIDPNNILEIVKESINNIENFLNNIDSIILESDYKTHVEEYLFG